jgi:hypothetical protein
MNRCDATETTLTKPRKQKLNRKLLITFFVFLFFVFTFEAQTKTSLS